MEIPTKVVRYFLGMTVLFGARTSLFKSQFVYVILSCTGKHII